MHGLKRGVLSFSEYDPNWPDIFAAEETRISEACAGHTYVIEHMGSTAIPGLLAKPIIDLSIAFKTAEELWYLVRGMTAIGYEFRGPHDHVNHWYCVYGEDDNRLFHAHLFLQDSAAHQAHILFRDALLSNEQYVADYAKKKLEWAEQTNWNRLAYSLSKTEFIRSVIDEYKDSR